MSTKKITLYVSNSDSSDYSIKEQIGDFTSDDIRWIEECLRQSYNANKFNSNPDRIEEFDFESRIFKDFGAKKMTEFLSKN